MQPDGRWSADTRRRWFGLRMWSPTSLELKRRACSKFARAGMPAKSLRNLKGVIVWSRRKTEICCSVVSEAQRRQSAPVPHMGRRGTEQKQTERNRLRVHVEGPPTSH